MDAACLGLQNIGRVFFQGLEGFVTDGMLQLAGIRRSGLLADTDVHQQLGQQGVPLIDLTGDLLPLFGQGDGTVTVTTDTDNLGNDRSQTLTFKTTGANPVTVEVTVTQPTGMKVLRAAGVTLRGSDGKVLRVPPA